MYEIENAKLRLRVLMAIYEASKELKCNNLILITWDTEDTIEYKDVTIEVVPVKKWFLQET